MARPNEARWTLRKGIEDIQNATGLQIGSGSVNLEDARGHFDILLPRVGTGLDIDAQNFDIQILWGSGLHLLVGGRRKLGVQAGKKKYGGEGCQDLSHVNLLAIAGWMRKRILADESFGCRAAARVI